MSYLTPGSGKSVPEETLRVIADLVGIRVPMTDEAALARSFADHLAAMDVLDRADLSTFTPVVEFDPRWR